MHGCGTSIFRTSPLRHKRRESKLFPPNGVASMAVCWGRGALVLYNVGRVIYLSSVLHRVELVSIGTHAK